MMRTKPGSYYAVSFDIGMNELKMVIADIASEILVQRELNTVKEFRQKKLLI